ncbi:MAG: tail fiber domain-containing protein [Gammaproteobacteria bacterium]|nr:tail fiber domain-containing protein [Gammaproteobacteria bacterium]
MPAGNAGTAGQVLVSQGPGLAPQWQDATTVGGDNWGSQVAQTQAPIVGDGTSSNPIGLQSGTASGDILVWDGSQWVVQQPSVSTGVAPICSSPTTDYVQKWTGSELCNSLIVDNGSEVGVGVASPVARLHVEAPSTYANALFVVRHDTNSASNPFFIVTRDGRVGVGTANPVMKFEIDYPVSSPAFVVTSDERFKEGIESISEGGSVLERVVRLRGVYYYWNEAYRELGRGDDRRHIGLIAQEVKEEFPELVYEWSDGSGYLMVDYDGMVPVLLEAIKELADLVEAQSQKVDELESLKGLIHLIEVQSRRIEELERRVLELETGSGVSSR